MIFKKAINWKQGFLRLYLVASAIYTIFIMCLAFGSAAGDIKGYYHPIYDDLIKDSELSRFTNYELLTLANKSYPVKEAKHIDFYKWQKRPSEVSNTKFEKLDFDRFSVIENGEKDGWFSYYDHFPDHARLYVDKEYGSEETKIILSRFSEQRYQRWFEALTRDTFFLYALLAWYVLTISIYFVVGWVIKGFLISNYVR